MEVEGWGGGQNWQRVVDVVAGSSHRRKELTQENGGLYNR